MNIAIVGMGRVGCAMAEFFSGHHTVIEYDVGGNIDAVNGCDIGVVCVPTPSLTDGACDTSIVEGVVNWMETDLIIVKSTVIPGTCRRLAEDTGKRIVFSPEYCGESSYWTPYKFHETIVETPFFIFGGNPTDTSSAVDLFLSIAGPTKNYLQCDWEEAEMAKYVTNSFAATKISFCYEMRDICRAAGIDWNTVRELWLQDPRVSPMHTGVFVENKVPFGGKCLPKDVAALTAFARKLGIKN